MEIQQIPNADWLDLLFDGRNKEYGAYDLRKNYNRRLKKSIALMGSICLVLAGGYTLAEKLGNTHVVKPLVASEIILADVQPEKKIETPLPQIPRPQHPAPQIAMIRDVTTRIVKDDQVKPDEVPPANADVDKLKIGTVNNLAGAPDDGTVPTAISDGAGKGLITTPPKQDDDDGHIFTKVEVESFYPGGIEAWKRFLIKNFRTPEEAIAQEISGTVIVQFIVDKEGNVSDVHAISGPEVFRQEAVRVIRRSGKWEPAIQNGRKVSSYKSQPIVVQLQNE
jgi:protein TonB